MQRTGTADLPLHYGKAPRWLFEKMCKLSREILLSIVCDSGPEEFIRKVSDPLWFQALGCVLAFDWHSSGLTTTVCGAIKEGIKGLEKEIGLFVAGGKGKASLKTPAEIIKWGSFTQISSASLVYASKMVAKVDSAALQDGFQLYHHCFIFSRSGKWAVIQQGMNGVSRYARRYHWVGEKVKSFVCEPHFAICSDWKGEGLNMVARESEQAKLICTQLSQDSPHKVVQAINKINNLKMPATHSFALDMARPKYLEKVLQVTYEKCPKNFEELLGIRGVGPKTIRALALISDLVYGVKPSFKDPATYSFAHGGKDGYPYPVCEETYEETISTLRSALQKARIGRSDKLQAIKNLATFTMKLRT